MAVARATCVYCGAPLVREDVEAMPPAPHPPAAPPDGGRTLVVLDLAAVSAAGLARALDRPLYEAGLVARRGRLHLHRILEPASAEAEAERLAALGLDAVLLPEAEARVRPLRALGGERGDASLDLRTEEGPLRLRRGDLLLVVRGPITREYQPSPRRRRVDTARLDEGYRLHLHRKDERRPVELDPASFEFGFAVTGSGRLELDAWTEEVAADAPRDDGFRRLPPALGPAEPETGGALAAASSLGLAGRGREGGRDEGPVILDNVPQFRFYSGWRAAVERRRG
ncbi:MAG TPA: hypothetical protein VLF95_13970 [Vicinamibacteria bacterium]|nr:hypothetical protein [Vicinamibacteria bacterium]